jgi:predicted RNase H-like nuclease (RuvC/YqgF family)
MLYKPGPLRSSAVRRSEGETRDLRSVCDHLEKELERKDQRNDNLSKELLSLRASFANQQVSSPS